MNDDNFKIIIPEVNSDSGLDLCRRNKKIYVQSLRLFAANIPSNLAKMRGIIPAGQNERSFHVTENNLKDYITNVHSVKGMCVYIGADEAKIFAKELEEKAEAGDLKSIFEKNEIFINKIETIINNIKIWFNSNSDFLEKIETGRKNE